MTIWLRLKLRWLRDFVWFLQARQSHRRHCHWRWCRCWGECSIEDWVDCRSPRRKSDECLACPSACLWCHTPSIAQGHRLGRDLGFLFGHLRLRTRITMSSWRNNEATSFPAPIFFTQSQESRLFRWFPCVHWYRCPWQSYLYCWVLKFPCYPLTAYAGERGWWRSSLCGWFSDLRSLGIYLLYSLSRLGLERWLCSQERIPRRAHKAFSHSSWCFWVFLESRDRALWSWWCKERGGS